ncbi:MAG: 6-pyruvoyl trahydropterin synthase family protein, partial [Thermoplasmata archaeon]
MESYVEIEGIFRDLRFSACHFIPGHDKCSKLHGHDYQLNIKIYGTKDENGMILDFTHLKEIIREIISIHDHRVLLPAKSRAMTIERKGKEISVMHSGRHYLFPAEDCVFCDIENITAELLSEYFCQLLCEKIGNVGNIEAISCGIAEGTGQIA